MATVKLSALFEDLCRRVRPLADSNTDCCLLERFFQQGDQGTFAAIVERHGPMVRSVCRRVLKDGDVDDAFQATFLVLASKGQRIRWRESMAGWLWSVAYRVACQARGRAARRQRHETEATRSMANPPSEPGLDSDLRDVLNEELARMPERYRLPLVLCYLEGQTTMQAAEHLGCSRGTRAGPLSRAREILRGRLRRRGLTPTSAGVAAVLGVDLAAAASPALVATTLSASSMLALGTPLSKLGVSSSVLDLVQGVLSDMFVTKLKNAGVAVVVVAVLGLGLGGLAQRVLGTGVDGAPAIPEAHRPVIVAADQRGDEKKPKAEAAPQIRKLTVKNTPLVPKRFTVTELGSENEAAQAINEDAAKQLAGQVDFTKENVVLVQTNAHFTVFVYEVKKTDGGHTLCFSMQTAAVRRTPAQLRQGMPRIEFYAAPKSVRATKSPPD